MCKSIFKMASFANNYKFYYKRKTWYHINKKHLCKVRTWSTTVLCTVLNMVLSKKIKNWKFIDWPFLFNCLQWDPWICWKQGRSFCGKLSMVKSSDSLRFYLNWARSNFLNARYLKSLRDCRV